MAVFTTSALATFGLYLGRAVIVGAGAGTFVGFVKGTSTGTRIGVIVIAVAFGVQMLRSK